MFFLKDCSLSFKSEEALLSHKKRHFDVKKCKKLNNKNVTNTSNNENYFIPIKIFKHNCEYCQETFEKKSQLVIHLKKHKKNEAKTSNGSGVESNVNLTNNKNENMAIVIPTAITLNNTSTTNNTLTTNKSNIIELKINNRKTKKSSFRNRSDSFNLYKNHHQSINNRNGKDKHVININSG